MACVRIILLLLISLTTAKAQTFSEWFRQKSTQKKYLLEQIAALQVYRTYALKGYSIAKGGLGSIGSYVGKEYGLHTLYYTKLKTVSAAVRNEPQVKAVLRWQQDILDLTDRVKKQDGLSVQEKKYVGTVCLALLKDCAGQLHDLETVLDDSKAEMSDEERLRQIARLHQNMQHNYRFAASFRNQLQVYVLQKQREMKDVQTIKKFYENDH